jgi:hypothetical protein
VNEPVAETTAGKVVGAERNGAPGTALTSRSAYLPDAKRAASYEGCPRSGLTIVPTSDDRARGQARSVEELALHREMRARRESMSKPAAVEGVTRVGGSTWQSLARRTGSTESDYLNGEIMLLGRLHGVATPANTALQHLSASMAREGRLPASFQPADVEALIARR